MTFDELYELCVAIRAHSVQCDYFKQLVKLIVSPEYGFKEQLKDQIFEIQILSCIYVQYTNLSQTATNESTEFIVWGVKEDIDLQQVEIQAAINKTISKGFNNFSMQRADITPDLSSAYKMFYFENTMGDTLRIIGEKALVSLIKQEERPS